MSEIGYNGRSLKIRKDGDVIAAVRTKTVTHNREAVDTTNDDSDSNRTLLPVPAMRSLDVQVEGVATSLNYQQFLTDWNGNALLDVTIENADGSIEEAEHGFFLGNLEFGGEYNGAVTFSAQLQSSGPMTLTPAP
jgi:predicted secreted protein